MRISISKSANAECFYVVKSFRKNGKNTTRIIEKLGNLEQVKTRANGQDPYEWAKEYAAKLTQEEEEASRKVMVSFSQSKLIESGEQKKFNGGYLFIQKIYSELGLKEICKAIDRRHDYEYKLNAILSRLVYCRIIKPASKLGTYEFSQNLLEAPEFSLHQIYRALDIITEEKDYILENLYKNSTAVVERNTDVLYYDCTNYFFEIEQEKGIRKYGNCKENRPLPIVEMGLLMDGDGIPLSLCINSGNTNEQITLKPLEEKILSDFGLSNFIVCTDAGLSSGGNKFFNSRKGRNFITAVPLLGLPDERSSKFITQDDWFLVGDDSPKKYNLNDIRNNEDLYSKYYSKTFYKEEWFIDKVDVFDEVIGKTVKRDLPQRLIVTFSFKYENYMATLRQRQIDRAVKAVSKGESGVNKKRQNDYHKYITTVHSTDTGDVAENVVFDINRDAISKAAKYDGFYAVYTSLDNDKYPVSKINSISHGRWEIEECFRILKTEFEARPVYLQKDNRIEAHFITCFIALMILRILEKKLNDANKKFTCSEIIDCLSDMDFVKLGQDGYIPAYTRSAITDALHDISGFRTDYEILSVSAMKKIFSDTKKGKYYVKSEHEKVAKTLDS